MNIVLCFATVCGSALAFAQPLPARSVAVSNFINPTSEPLPTAPPVAADADDGGNAMDLDLGDMFELADAAAAADGEAAADEAA